MAIQHVSAAKAMDSREAHSGWLGMLKSAFLAWREDDAPHLGAALAYYTVFSIAPLMLVLIGVAGMVFGREAVEGQVFGALASRLGAPAAKTIQDALAAMRLSGHSTLSTVVGVVVLLFGASGVFGELKVSLNKIWKVQPKPGGGLKRLIATNFSQMMLLAGTAFLMVVTLVLSAGLAALGAWFARVLPGNEAVWQAVNFLFSLAVISLVFAAVFRLVPDIRIAWSDAIKGGFCTALLFTLGQFLLGLYIGRAKVGTPFGAAGSLVILLVWVYYTSQIFFFGAEITRAYAALRGHGAKPDPDALVVPPGPEGVPGTNRQEAPAPRDQSSGLTPPKPA